MTRKENEDGFGQSTAEDLAFAWRFRRCRRLAVSWHVPSDAEQREFDAHPVIGRFGDMTPLVAQVGVQRWLVRERMWFGWPDPPQYAFFALEQERIVIAWDFNAWPSTWTPAPG